MNKSKLRERLKKDLDIFIDSVGQEMQTDEVFLTEGYWFYDDLLNFAEKLVAKNRKAILEEVRKIVGEDEEAFEETVSLDLGGYNDPEITKNVGYKTRNKFRAELNQKLSLLEGK